MTEGVVDVLEAIEIQQQHGHLLARPLRVFDRLLDPVVEQGAIGQPGERVVQRHALELGFLQLAFGDIAQDRDADPFLVDLHAAEGGLDREGPPGAVPGFKLLNAARLSEDLERAVLLIRQQRTERPADHVLGRHPEDPLRGAVVGQGIAVGVEGDDRIEAVVDQLAHHVVCRGQGADLADQRARLVLDPSERGDAKRQDQADQAGAGVQRHRVEQLKTGRERRDRQHAAAEQQERAAPGQAAEGRPGGQDQQRSAQRRRPAPNGIERASLRDGLDRQRLDQGAR